MKNCHLLEILGVKVSNIPSESVLEQIESQFQSPRGSFFLTTLNPEIVLTASKDATYRNILNQATFSMIDGVGLQIALSLLTRRRVYRMTGVEFTVELLQRAARHKKRIGVILQRDGLSTKKEVEYVLHTVYGIQHCLVSSIQDGNLGDNVEHVQCVERLKNFGCEVLLAALGAPWQEQWIYDILKEIPTLQVAVGIGGTFDFFTGKIQRAPRFLQKIGLEWLWRLLQEPQYRYRRIGRAVFLFPWHVLLWKMKTSRSQRQ